MPSTVDPSLVHQASRAHILDTNSASRDGGRGSRSTSPVPPSHSPLTPTVRPALPVPSQAIGDLDRLDRPSAQLEQKNGITKSDLIDRPPPRPFSGEDATDAIALRAAISSLQYQKQKAGQDIKTLRKIRDDALARPDDFQQHILNVARQQAQPPKDFDFSSKRPSPDSMDTSDDEDVADGPHATAQKAAFPPFPLPQDVVRMPPVNWDKYHIVGEPLDKMHNVQRMGPVVTASRQGTGAVARPYDPAVDRLDATPSVTGKISRDSKKDSRTSTGSRRGSKG